MQQLEREARARADDLPVKLEYLTESTFKIPLMLSLFTSNSSAHLREAAGIYHDISVIATKQGLEKQRRNLKRTADDHRARLTEAQHEWGRSWPG